eukprot:gb/GECG01004303.1/.p1 GENE.gb/GECG01004303.1/~~gb/GECG01004303.1/.p1  ORF type:complete len:165 (+),score=12.06 gb/GECG01004303.1/:1-495(+)
MSFALRRIFPRKTPVVMPKASPLIGMAPASHTGLPRVTGTWNSTRHFADDALGEGDSVPVTFITPDGTRIPVNAPVGDTLLEVAHDNDIEIEGACGGECACSTCHVILPEAYYNKLDTPSEEEEDMLDLAAGLTDTSRLCCQVVVEPELKDMEISLPDEVNNML